LNTRWRQCILWVRLPDYQFRCGEFKINAHLQFCICRCN
jgi:hypothetical protein